MLVAALRQRILDLAIRGKLVPQRLEDGTAEELYRQILQEKKKLITAGKIKKEKKLSPITGEEIPFDIPKSWKWVRLGEIAELGSGLTPSKQNSDFYAGGTIPWLLTGDLNDGYIDTIPNKITEKALSATTIKIKPANSIVVAMYGATIGKLGILREPACMNQACCCIEVCERVWSLYVFYYLWANKQPLKSAGVGGAQPNISKEKLVAQMLPLPPFEEQKRIVQKVEILFAELESIERSQEKVAAIQGELNKRILERAIQGKLVPQRPEEGTAEDLYQQIQQEKKKLIAASKLKKEKPLLPITEEEIPFDIPDSWKWVHLDNIAQTALGKTLDKYKNTGDYHPYLCSINVYWSGIDLSKVKEARFENDELSKYRLKKGDLLICEGGDAGRTAIWESDTEMYYQNALHRVRFYGGISPYFYKYLLEYYGAAGILKAHCKGQTIKHLVQKSLCSMWLPMPPIAEQQRIVEKLEEMLTQIE